MYLTKLTFDLRNKIISSAFVDCYKLHQLIYAAFDGCGRILFRTEKNNNSYEAVVLVLTESMAMNMKPLVSLINIETKLYSPELENGDVLHFSMRANPTAMNIKRRPLRDDEKLEWLNRKGSAGGFSIRKAIFNNEGNLSGKKGAQTMTFNSVLFNGILQVTDHELFRSTLFNGLGSAKGFGFGLLSIARG